jgi:hypothetical protein
MYSTCDVKWVYICCVGLFEIGSTLCAAAPNMDLFITGRAICGFGGSGMYIGVMTLLSFLTTETERAKYLGLTGLTWGAGIVMGPLIGGGFAASSATWRWGFWINLCFGVVCAPLCLFMIPSKDSQSGLTILKRLRNIDLIGVVLMIGTLISGLMAINFGGTLYAWKSAQIIALFAVFIVLTVMFFVQQIYSIGTTPGTRSFPLHFFQNKQLCLLFVIEACASTLNFLPIYFLPLYFQFAKGSTAIESGVQSLPLVTSLVVTICGSGFVTSYFPFPFPWFLMGSTCGLAGAVLLKTVDPETPISMLYGYSVLIGFGGGCFVTLCFAVAQVQVSNDQIPLVVGLITFSHLSASAVSLSIANTLFLNLVISRTEAVLPEIPSTDIYNIVSGVGTQVFANLSPHDRYSIVSIIVQSLDDTYIIGIACGAVSLILSLFLNKGRMRR